MGYLYSVKQSKQFPDSFALQFVNMHDPNRLMLVTRVNPLVADGHKSSICLDIYRYADWLLNRPTHFLRAKTIAT